MWSNQLPRPSLCLKLIHVLSGPTNCLAISISEINTCINVVQPTAWPSLCPMLIHVLMWSNQLIGHHYVLSYTCINVVQPTAWPTLCLKLMWEAKLSTLIGLITKHVACYVTFKL